MKLRIALLTTVAFCALSTAARADETEIMKRLDAMQHMMEQQQKQIESQRTEISSLRQQLSRRGEKAERKVADVASTAKPTAPSVPASVSEQVAAQQQQIDTLSRKLDATQTEARLARQEAPTWSLAGGRPTVTSADGRFSAAIRMIAQYDSAYYMQSAAAQQFAAANGPDLSSGANFRRAQLGIQGKVFGDWSYYFNYDFAGAGGTETPGHIQQIYVQYDGLAPWAFRIGAFPASAGLEDNTASADTIFLERNSPSDLARNIGGGDGRNGIAITYAGERIYGALTYTGNKVQDSGSFDEQQAVVSRLSYLAYASSNLNAVVSVNGTDAFHIADTAAGANAPQTITLSDPPELTVDNTGTKFVSTGALDADQVWEWGVESAVQYQNLYGQAGYFQYGVDSRTTAGGFNFDGWYAQATWVLTGESRNYSSSTGSFTNPKPRIPFSLSGGGWGAWELAARYSDLNLNDNAGAPGAALPAGGLRGGDQRIVTVGLNWFPTSVLKFELQYQNINIGRIGTIPAGFGHGALSNADVGQTLNTIAFRSQISL
jgi:phosphate-selective porin OprO/OprP